MKKINPTMATKKVLFDFYAIDSLKNRLMAKTSFAIANKTDCARLSELIAQNGTGYLSETTLYRIFFQPGKHSPYRNTLDILCQFIGFKDSLDFLESINFTRELVQSNGLINENNSFKTLLFFCVENKSFKPLANFFDAIDHASEEFKSSFCIALFDCLRYSNEQPFFFKKFVNQTYIREYLLEKGHDPKFRLSSFHQAYSGYLKGVDKDKGIKEFQDYLFGNTVLFRYLYLTGKYQKALELGKSIYQTDLSIERYQDDLNLFPYIRYRAYKIWYYLLDEAKITTIEAYVNFLLHLCKTITPSLAFSERKIVFHTTAEAFLHAKVQEKYINELKLIFLEEYTHLPSELYSKKLSFSLPYFEPNGLIYHRP